MNTSTASLIRELRDVRLLMFDRAEELRLQADETAASAEWLRAQIARSRNALTSMKQMLADFSARRGSGATTI